jgi:hypothetical protein
MNTGQDEINPNETPNLPAADCWAKIYLWLLVAEPYCLERKALI